MRPDLATMIRRVEEMREQLAAVAAADDVLLESVEDMLTEGYAHALEGDAWSIRGEERLHELISDTDSLVRGRELRKLAADHARFQHEVIALRRELAELRRVRGRLPARPHAV